MLRFYKLPYFDGKFTWEVSYLSGNLLRSEHPSNNSMNLTKRLEKAIHYINNPFQIKWDFLPKYRETSFLQNKKIISYNRILFKLGNSKFLLSIFYSYFNSNIFETTKESFSFISNLSEHKYGSENCFQRCLLAAKISKSFKKNGFIFIGAEISTLNMHAWIIEDGEQPDFEDRVWINYQPLLAITFE